FYFFFQAEDGIRDRNVTGVQTCALPISMRAQFDRRLISQALTNIIKNATEAIEQVPPEELGKGRIDVIAAREKDDIVIDVIDNRSEERRVGKECRSRWAAGDEKKREQEE